MSVVAWDGSMIAADGRGVYGDDRLVKSTKIWSFDDGEVIAGVGCHAELLRLRDILRSPLRTRDAWPSFQKRGDFNTIIVANQFGAVLYQEHDIPVRIEDTFFAIGTGSPYAIGAMAMGANAVEAVEIACAHDIHCGLPVMYVPLGACDHRVVVKEAE